MGNEQGGRHVLSMFQAVKEVKWRGWCIPGIARKRKGSSGQYCCLQPPPGTTEAHWKPVFSTSQALKRFPLQKLLMTEPNF